MRKLKLLSLSHAQLITFTLFSKNTHFLLKILPLAAVGLLTPQLTRAQFTPPGMGSVHTADWLAIGMKQSLNEQKSISSASFFGVGRTSNPNNYNPFQRNVIYVINEEISHRFQQHWQYSGALSYRWQHEYQSAAPYETATPKARQEIRVYGRYSYLTGSGKLNFAVTYRPELRLFYNPNFGPAETSMQFRSRFSGKMTWNLNASKSQKLILNTELLFSTSKEEQHWSQWGYNETRISLYYSITLPNNRVILDIGYMNDLLEMPVTRDVHYLAFDLTFKNPFSHAKKSDPASRPLPDQESRR